MVVGDFGGWLAAVKRSSNAPLDLHKELEEIKVLMDSDAQATPE